MKNLLEELVGDPIKVDEAREKAGELKWLERSKSDFTLDGMPMPQPMRGPLSPQERYYLVNELRCKFTEYLPIHAVVASDNHVMYDFMVDICGANARLEVHELSALKLAVVLGKQAMVKHILKRRLKIHWTWGPVTQYMIPLDEIDTAGSRVIPFPERCLGNLQLLEETFHWLFRRPGAIALVGMSHTVSGLGGSMREKDFGVGPYKPPRLLRIHSAPPARPQPSGVRFVRSPSRGSIGASQDTLNQNYSAELVRTQGSLIRNEVCTSAPTRNTRTARRTALEGRCSTGGLSPHDTPFPCLRWSTSSSLGLRAR